MAKIDLTQYEIALVREALLLRASRRMSMAKVSTGEKMREHENIAEDMIKLRDRLMFVKAA